MRLKAVTCIPSVKGESDVTNLGNSRIVHLPFEEWLALEGQSQSAPYNKLEWRYNKNPPVFWERMIDADSRLVLNREPENVRTLSSLIKLELEAVVKALHWYTGTAPINPLRSVTYFDPRSDENFAIFPDLQTTISEKGVQRRYGESEKEYATQNESPTILLRQIDDAPLAEMVSFTEQTREVWTREQYELAAQSLSLCSAPGLNWTSRILLLVGAYESLLLPDRTIDLQKGFETRFSSMAATHFGEVNQHANRAKIAYRLRSDLVHGRSLVKSLEKMSMPPDEFVQTLGQAGVLVLCKLIAYRHMHPEVEDRTDPLWLVLDSADRNAEAFAYLQTAISHSPAVHISHQWQQEEGYADIANAPPS
jgi:hypothetical protein